MAIRLDAPVLAGGLLREDPYLETHLVRPGGATVLDLRPDERLTVIDRDGGQVAEVSAIGSDGRDAGAALGAHADAPATVLQRALAARDGDLLLAELASRGLDPHEASALRLFGPASPPGASHSFLCERDVTVIVAAPAGRIVDGDPPPSDLLVEVRRTTPRRYGEIELPPPLAEPRLDFRVDKATARSYEVRAGEYIQVIDVEGKQCSDFLAFHRAKLEDGVERGLDSTVTRTLMGNAYPTPGLHGKFYDVDMDPLVEVVRDTVGRHDTFALACTAKYYEDMGYPGHTNCTENFNGQLDPYGIAPRRGWPALNFFYNTSFDSTMVMTMDEPWSRPGDYVLLRAMTDLVCASSACPDDIDPANGWQITDVHVRVYSPENRFSAAIAHRVTPDAEPVLTRETTFHPRTSALTTDLTEYRGYWLPNRFHNEGAIAEYWACREKVAVMDLSPLRKWEILGPDAEALVQAVITRDARRLSVGQVTYTAVCNEAGGMIDDGTVFRLGPDNFRFVGGDEYDGVWLKEQARGRDLRVQVKPSTDQLHNLAVQGPESRALLAKIVWTPPTQTPLPELKWFRFTIGRIGDYRGIPIVVSRTGYTGELGYEVWCHPSDGPAVWDAVWEAGRAHGLAPLGLEALDILRIEAGLIFAGYEFDDSVDPFEAGIPFVVNLDSEEDFLGRDALVERSAHPQRTLVGLELEGNETAGHGDPVYVGRQRIGVVTSGTRSPVLRKNIALARLAVQFREIGTHLEVGKLDGHQKRIAATVVPIPFYDPEKTRVRA
ncbi:MAG: aminomethyltransferase family protein [Actinomycetota bacterium]|nr:aminomethyltransferase family protein [Actinomycetota bacterium]